MKRIALMGLLISLACFPDEGLDREPDALAARLEFSAAMIESSGSLRAEVTVTNTNPKAARLEYAGICAVALLLWPGTGPAGMSPAWDEQQWYNTRPGGCKWMPATLQVEAASSAVIRTSTVPVTAVIGDSLPPGRYDATVRLRLLQPRDTVLLLPAGVVVVGEA